MRIFKYLLSLVLALSCFCSQMTAAPKPQKKPAASAMKPKPKEKPLPKEPAPSKEGIDFFEKKIRPVLIRHCYECHSGDPAKAKAHLVLDNHDGLRRGGDSGPAVLPGHVETSLIIEAIHYEGLEMPPKGRLPEDVVADFETWVRLGAPDPRVGKAANPNNKIDLAAAKKYWAFQPPKIVASPKLEDAAWPINEIDKWVRAKQEQKKLKPVEDADRTTLIRRVTFDLTGLPPTPEEMDAFVKDSSANAFPTVVDRLLASPRFGERWGRHWLDVARYAESTGKDLNIAYRYAWRYRDYVIDAFNADKPYDRFILEQLAGDLLPSKTSAEKDKLEVATGFLALGPKGVNTKKPEQFKMDVIDDQIDVTGRAFLGMTIACARCHDHKFDPIPISDYYAMAGIFHSTETYAGVVAGRKSATDSRLLSLSESKDSKAKQPTKEQKAHMEEIAKVQSQLDDLHKTQKTMASQKAGEKGKGKGQKQGKQLREKIKELEDKLEELESSGTPAAALMMGVKESENPANVSVLLRGELDDKGPEVPRGLLTVLKTAQTSSIPTKHSGRLELANWIVQKENPLTARVMVNRVWEHLFGQGIVDSVDNFGAMGEEPTNAELLDTLAVRFVEQKWSVKKLIRLIVLSRTYQLSSDHDDDNYELDAGNKYFWRMERRRLDAEEIRDAMLFTSGLLDTERPEGSPVMEIGNGVLKGGKGLQEVKKPSTVRSVYLPILRGVVPEMLSVFDFADPSLIVGKRDVTTVPTQALFLMNNPFVLHQAEQMAARLLKSPDKKPEARIKLAFQLAFGRDASETELEEMTVYLEEYRKYTDTTGQSLAPQLAAWTSLCQTLFECGEFRTVY